MVAGMMFLYHFGGFICRCILWVDFGWVVMSCVAVVGYLGGISVLEVQMCLNVFGPKTGGYHKSDFAIYMEASGLSGNDSKAAFTN